MSIRSPLVAMAAMISLALVSVTARAAGFADPVRYVFVAATEQSRVAVIDSRDDSIAGHLDLGLVPRQLEVLGEPGRLAAIDGASARVALVALESGVAAMLPLDFVPTRLVTAGSRLVAAAPSSGRMAVIDPAAGAVAAQAQVAPFRDLQPAGDGTQLVLAQEGVDGVAVMDVATLAVSSRVASPQVGPAGFSALARSPNGRVVYGRSTTAPTVMAIDARAGRVVGEVAVGAGMARAYTDAVGITVVLPDSVGRSITLLPASLKGGVTMAGEAGMSGVYSGWFDTVSFIPSTATKTVLVVDQQGRFRDADIVLGATPGRGTVTPDGRKFYLPLTDANRVAVIDAEQRKLVGYVTLPAAPSMALMGRTFGICH